MSTTLHTGIVGIVNEKRNRIEGTGFLVAKDLVVTCAHVIQSTGKGPGQEVELQIRASKQTVTALVEPTYWKPPDQEDIAFLRLLDDKTGQEEILLLGTSSGTSGHPFETLGFPASLDEARGYGTIGGPVTLANRKLLQLTGTTEITAGFSGAPVLDKQTRRVIGMVASIARPDAHGRLTEIAFIIPSETLRAACEEIQLSDICPYQSLDTFTEQNAEFFFGREEITQRILERLRGKPRFLAILGSSGSGKSSLIQAGVIPQLRAGKILGSEKWGILVTRPADVLMDAFRHQEQDTFTGGLAAYREWLDGLTQAKHLLLVIDQFEELLIAEEKEAVQVYVELLTGFLETGRNLTLIMILRDDFYGRLSQMAPELLPWLERGLINIPQTLTQDELNAIIQKPAESVGLSFETGLVETLIRDAVEVVPNADENRHLGRSTTLPLLEFTLTQLWEKRTDGVMTFQAYKTIGGVTGGLAQWAQDTFDALSEPQQRLARSILTSLVHLGDESQSLPDTRRRRPVKDLYRDFGENQIGTILERFTKARLLASFRDERQNQEYVEIVHEALIWEWEALRYWLKDDQSFLRWRQEVENRTRTWVLSNPEDIETRDEGKLLRGRDLLFAEDTLSKRSQELAQDIRDFIHASAFLRDKEENERETARRRELEQAQKLAEEQQQRLQAQRQRAIYLTVGLTVAVLLSILSFSLFRTSNRNLEDANQANTQSIANAETAQAFSTLSAQNASTAEARRILAENAQATAQAEAITRATAQSVAEHQALRAQAGGLSVQAIQQLEQQDDLAMLLGIEAFSSTVSLQTRQALYAIWKYNPQLIQIFQGHQGSIFGVAFSPNGVLLASGSSDGTIRLWDIGTGQPLGEPLTGHIERVYSVAFSPDGLTLASASDDDTIRLWDVETGQPLGEPLTGHEGAVFSVAFSPDGHILASGSSDHTIRLWDVGTGQPLGETLAGHTDWVWSVAFSPDGQTLASGSDDDTVRLWNVETRQPLGEPIVGHQFSVRDVAFSTDGQTLASVGSDVRLWDVVVGSPTFGQPLGEPLTGHTHWIVSVAFSPDGQTIVSGSLDATIRLWDVATGQPLGEPLTGHQGTVLSTAFSPNGQALVSGSSDNTIRLWDFEIGQSLTGHKGRVNSVVFSPDGRTLASGSSDDTIRLWDVETGQLFGEPLIGHQFPVNSVAFSPDGQILASGSLDSTIRLWSVHTGHPLGEPLAGHQGDVNSIAFSPDGQILASGSSDATIRLWDVGAASPTFGQPLSEPLAGHTGVIRSVAFSPDGQTLASGSIDTTIRLWDVDTRHPIGEPLTGHTSLVRSVAFSPNGQILASGSDDNTIRLWYVYTGEPIGEPLAGHTDSVTSVAFSPDGQMLASGSIDTTIRLWDVATVGSPTFGQPFGEPLTRQQFNIFSLAFSPDGQMLASGFTDATIRLWDIDPGRWIVDTCQRVGRNLMESEWMLYLSWKGPFDPTYKTCPQWP